MSEEKRIYVVVAETVQAPDNDVVIQPAGRIAAQVGHAVSKMWSVLSASRCTTSSWEPTTTIILSARDSAELQHIQHVLTLARVDHVGFKDTNEEYGYSPDHKINHVFTAVCTYPIEPKRRENLLDHLPLWTPRCN